MDDLRWTLLLVGAIVVVAIYFSGRFESEDWKRERKQFAKKAANSVKKTRRENPPAKPSSTVTPVIKKEPTLGVLEPIVEKPARSELVIDTAPENDVAPEAEEPKVAPPEHVSPVEKAAPHESINSHASIDEVGETLPAEEPLVPSVEDEITEVEIPVDLAVAEAEIHIADTATEDESVEAEIPLDIEPLVLSVSVLADEEEVFTGPDVKEALEAEGLRHGAMSIFHFYDPDKADITEKDDAVFSVANVLEPGFFDLNTLDEIQTPGLMLFCQLPGPVPGEAALEMMLDKGRGLAVRLNGHMCDDKRNPFTSQARTYYQDKIATFTRELELAKKKADV